MDFFSAENNVTRFFWHVNYLFDSFICRSSRYCQMITHIIIVIKLFQTYLKMEQSLVPESQRDTSIQKNAIEAGLQQHGKSTPLWLQLVRLERTTGDAKAVRSATWRAMRGVENPEAFEAQLAEEEYWRTFVRCSVWICLPSYLLGAEKMWGEKLLHVITAVRVAHDYAKA